MFWLKHLRTSRLKVYSLKLSFTHSWAKMRDSQWEDGMGHAAGGGGGGQSLKPSQQDGAEQVQVRNLTFTSTNETGTWDILAWDDTTVQDQRQIWGVYVFFLTAANGGPCSPGWMLVAKEKKNIQAHSKSEVLYTSLLKPLKALIMFHLKQLRWCRSLSTLDFHPPIIFFFFFFPHPETVSSNSQVHTALLFSH